MTNFPGGKSVRAWLYRRRLRSLFKYSSRIIAVSEFIRDRAILLGADPGKTVVHHIGIPIDRSPAIMKKSGIVFVGRFSEKKGILDLLSAVGMLEGGLRQTRIDLVGDGPLRTEAESIARVLGLNTRFHGALSPAAVSAVMAGGLLFCGPSRTARNGDAEGLGMVFLEAGAHAMPTVAYRHGGVSEAISHGETGILVEEGDVAALSRALSRVLTDDLLRIRLGAGARKRVEEDFDICIQTEKLEAMYDSVVATWAASEGPQ
ncbi:glycosyltransferase involved in cell wall biosynthesis [Cryobacterium sp. MP_M3]|nr:glycosyltransferase involved in cell wall biosynthesis [Cryobacterium sp. MP_M3]